MKSIAVSNVMLRLAQSSYEANPEYGLSDNDMRVAIKAALDAAPDQQATIDRLTAELDAWKANAEAFAKECADIRGDCASWCSPAFAAHAKLKGDV